MVFPPSVPPKSTAAGADRVSRWWSNGVGRLLLAPFER
jgi:hypothetical protein